MSNQQEGNDPLDIGLNALATVEKSKGGRGVTSELSVSGFAERLGKTQQYIGQVIQAATVYEKVKTQVSGFDPRGMVKHLKEIHAAPSWLWSALVSAMIEGLQGRRDAVHRVVRVERVSGCLCDRPTSDVCLCRTGRKEGYPSF